MPIDVIMFCIEPDLSEEAFSAKLADPKLAKKEAICELDPARIASAQQLKDMLGSSSLIKTYKDSELYKGVIYAGTQFEHKVVKSQSYILINMADPKKTKIEVLGDKAQFVESVLKDMLDIMSK